MKLLYYREPNGDYLCVMRSTYDHFEREGSRLYEGRATTIANVVSSTTTTGISEEFLRGCKRVRKRDVPQEWLDAFGA